MKLETYRKQQERTANMLPKLRSQKARRNLIRCYGILVALTLVGAALVPLSISYLMTIVAGLGAMSILWTMIRITIDSEDMAPVEVLDEYQYARLESYRSFAFKLFSFFGGMLALFLIFGSMFAPDAINFPRVGASLGYITLIMTLLINGYPALALAWNKPDED